MFGLMRAKKCGMSTDEKQFRRLHYCGMCKTIGSLYSQKSRLMLNHDTVFLAEILTSLSGENVSDWQNAYQSFNCLNLPETAMPDSLQFAAATNIILAEFKIADHIHDSRQFRFKVARRVFSNEFLNAESSLKGWNFPLEKVRRILQTQEKIETENSSLEILAEPTALVTALFFAHGVDLIGRSELKNIASEIGYSFGKLIYLLDAFEDFASDAKAKQFNAISSIFALRENKLPKDIYRKVSAILRELEREIAVAIYKLPIEEMQKQIFVLRLQENLGKKLKTELPVLKSRKIHLPKSRQTFAERYHRAIETARKLAENYSWQMPLIFLLVFIFALVAPTHTREAKSARECFDLSFNLMFLGSVFSSAAIFAKPLFMENPQMPPPSNKRGKPVKLLGRSSQNCFCGCFEDCDCCCDSCDCCSDCGGCDC